jgi:hypothetical protein
MNLEPGSGMPDRLADRPMNREGTIYRVVRNDTFFFGSLHYFWTDLVEIKNFDDFTKIRSKYKFRFEGVQ